MKQERLELLRSGLFRYGTQSLAASTILRSLVRSVRRADMASCSDSEVVNKVIDEGGVELDALLKRARGNRSTEGEWSLTDMAYALRSSASILEEVADKLQEIENE